MPNCVKKNKLERKILSGFISFLYACTVKWLGVMDMKGKTWLLAILMGVVIPNIFFSVTEKILPPKAPVTSESTVEEPSTKQTEPSVTTVQVLHNGTIKQIDLDTYLVGVLLGEMPVEFEMEALKAQAVVARTYTLKRCTTGQKHTFGGVCTDSTCCQAYCSVADYISKGGTQAAIDKVISAVNSTAGQVLTYQGELIEATYFSCSGGRTEDALAVWGTEIPYLQAVDSPGEENAAHYVDSIKLSADEFTRLLDIKPKGTPASWFGTVTHTKGGGVDTMIIAGYQFKGTTLRQKLGLRSTAFVMSAVGDSIHITTKGFGHRVGMSQYGAEAMAVKGSGYKSILAHYYPGTTLNISSQN